MKMKITGNGARNLNRAALNSGRTTRRRLRNSARLNSSRWDWDAWDDHAKQIPVSSQIAKAVDQYADSDSELKIEKVLQPTGDVGSYLKRVGIKALIFVYDPADREGYEEILGWTGSEIDDSSAFNLADIQDNATRRHPVNSNRKTTRRQLNSNHTATKRPAINSAARRPIAPVLNSSARRTPASDARNYKLNSGLRSARRLNSSASEVKLPAVWDKYYDITSDSKTAADRAGIDVSYIVDWDKEIEDSGYGKVIGYLSAKPEYVDFLDELGELNVLADGTVGYGIGGERGVRFYSVSINEIKDLIDRAQGVNSSRDSRNCSKSRKPVGKKLNSGLRRPLKKLNSNRSAILKELEGWFDKDEAVEYLDSFENTTGATATKLATDEEVDKYDGVFWATKDGKESLWCLHNGMWVEQDLDSAKNLNSAEGEAEEADNKEEEAKEETVTEKEEAATEEETTVTDADGNEIVVEDLLIVQDPESKEISLFVPESEDDALPEGVEVIAEVEATTELDSSCHGKAKKLNSAEGEATEEEATEEEATETVKDDEATGEETTEEEAIIELPDGEAVNVEDIYVVQDAETKELDIFIVEEDNDTVPEGIEVIGEATPADDETVLDSARKLKKFAGTK